MLEKTADEFFGRYGAGHDFASFGRAVAKADMRVGHFEDALVVDGHAKDVGRQVLHFSAEAPSPTDLQCTTQGCRHTFAGISS